jgi:hypothetical protein
MSLCTVAEGGGETRGRELEVDVVERGGAQGGVLLDVVLLLDVDFEEVERNGGVDSDEVEVDRGAAGGGGGDDDWYERPRGLELEGGVCSSSNSLE